MLSNQVCIFFQEGSHNLFRLCIYQKNSKHWDLTHTKVNKTKWPPKDSFQGIWMVFSSLKIWYQAPCMLRRPFCIRYKPGHISLPLVHLSEWIKAMCSNSCNSEQDKMASLLSLEGNFLKKCCTGMRKENLGRKALASQILATSPAVTAIRARRCTPAEF